jgi:acyl-CoA reductase-like NAD-dependent aldehyde dehydrogenase
MTPLSPLPIPNRYSNYVGGEDVPAGDGVVFDSINPTTGAVWGVFARSSALDVDQAVRSAHKAFTEGPWASMSCTRRGRLLMRLGDKLFESADRIGRIETHQNGKLLAEMAAQVRAAQDWFYYFGGLADKVEGAVIPMNRTSVFNYTLREPMGVVGVITPWNSPTFLVAMAAAPALAAGNTVVLKPSELTSASAIELARLAIEVGFPPGVINVVTGLRETGEALVDHELVRKINFTGGDVGGRLIAQRAGKRLVDCVLELGGKSPNIVFDDAKLEQAEAGILSGIFAAAGQTCVAGSRAYIHEKIYDKFVDRLVTRAQRIVVGDPLSAKTQMGPVASVAQLQKDENMVLRAVSDGAEILCGGKKLQLEEFPNGLFFAPTILHNARPDNFIVQNEVFGPVLSVVPFRTEEEVLMLANDTPFGLAAGLWTTNLQRAHLMARKLQAGTVWINTYRALGFNTPFGGYKTSGLGKQNGAEAIKQYLQTKSVWCELGDEIEDPFILKT